MNIYQDSIDRQFEFNQDKNLFNEGILQLLRFSSETRRIIEKPNAIDPETENLLIDYMTGKAIQEFCKLNQYYSFDQTARSELKIIYISLFTSIKKQIEPINIIEEKHYLHLKQWLQKSNPFAKEIYTSKGEILNPIACSEYSPEMQTYILQIKIEDISEPILDIGCGKQANLVCFLRQAGKEAYGFDRFAKNNSFLRQSDWFEYNFEKNKWGCITSHLGFSNHFQHHHLRNDGNFVGYAKKFMEILGSLKIGGTFHYAPNLPFIETYLDQEKYQITLKEIDSYGFKSAKITRLK